MPLKNGTIIHPISCFIKLINEPSLKKNWRDNKMKIKEMFLGFKNPLKSKTCIRIATSWTQAVDRLKAAMQSTFAACVHEVA